MSQEELADRSGISASSISAYERGFNDPSLEALGKLSDALGVPRGMIADIDPSGEPELWAAYLGADEGQRLSISRMAAGLVGERLAKKKRR